MVLLTREVRFSVAPNARPTGREFANTWAGWPAAEELAPYLRLRATFAGEPDAATGYLCDIKEIDELLQTNAVPLAYNLLREQPLLTPTQLLQALWCKLPEKPFAGTHLVRLQLVATPYQFFTVQRDQPDMIHYTEQFEFSASHRLHSAELTEQQNRDFFGKCNNPKGHGHNYVLEITVAADHPHPPVRVSLGAVVKHCVLDRFDHKHLNEDTDEFRQLNPTVENITKVVWQLLAVGVQPIRLLNVRVYETPKTWADYSGEQ